MLSFFINAVKIIFVLGFLVFIHESGHFLVAKFFKVRLRFVILGKTVNTLYILDKH